MSANVGTIDRILRAVLGVVMLYLGLFSGLALFDAGLFKYGAAIIGLVMLATSTLSICPLYSFLGVKTCRDC